MTNNICYRCGKQRIFVKSHKEKIGSFSIKTTEMSCPDAECQKIVDKENRKRSEKYETMQLKKTERYQRKSN